VNKSSNNGFHFFVNGDLVISVNRIRYSLHSYTRNNPIFPLMDIHYDTLNLNLNLDQDIDQDIDLDSALRSSESPPPRFLPTLYYSKKSWRHTGDND
jgi:hypothetical protein